MALSSVKGLPTGRVIEAEYRNATGKDIEHEALVKMLEEAKEASLVKGDMANSDDEPILVWKRGY